MKTNLLLTAIACSVIGLFSCSEDNMNGDFSENETKSAEIRCINNLLVFPDNESLRKTLNGDLPDGIKKIFISQQSIFDTLVEKEYQRALVLKELSDEEYYKIDRHCDYYRELLGKKIIKETNYTDGSQLYQLNLCLPAYGKILNLDGCYAINDTIYQIEADKLKVWKNGDIKNFRILNDILETNVSKNIYVYDYSTSETDVKTRTLFPLKSIDQEVAYYGYYDPTVSGNPANAIWRGIVTFYDKTTLALPGYKRNIFIRISYQEKTDGRNFNFVKTPFALIAFFNTYVDKQPAPSMDLYANGTASDIWYTVYFPYEFLVEGKEPQTATDRYWNIVNYTLNVAYSDKSVFTKFKGTRQAPLEGIFNYQGYGNAVRLNTLLS